MADIGCVIMASGLGTRFGGNKLMATLGKKPLIAWALDAAEGLFAARVVVTRHADVADHCAIRDVRCILHDLPLRSDTVRLGIQAMPDTVSGCLFLPGDQPLLSRMTLTRLLDAATREPECIWRASFSGEPGAPVLFPRWTFQELASLPAGKGGGVLTKRYPDCVRCVEAGHAWELTDADTPEALEGLAQILAQMER